jgi:hypothetical protein
MYRVERHIIVKSKEMDTICFLSKNLYNYVNFILRQVYTKNFDSIIEYKHLIKSFKIKDKEYFKIDEYDLVKELAKNNQVDYRSLSSQASQKVVSQVYQDWKIFYKLIKIQSKLNGKSKMPNYKDKGGKNVVIFTTNICRIKDGNIYFYEKSNLKPLINADINGALNIMRKVVDDSLVKEIINRGLVFNPMNVICS